MSTDADLAAAFYGATTPTGQPDAGTPTAKTSEQSLADSMYSSMKTKAEPTASTRGNQDVDVNNDEDLAKVMFQDSPIYAPPLLAIQNAALQELANPEDAAEIAASWEAPMRAFELNSSEASELTALGVNISVNVPDAAVIDAWAADAKSALRQEYGDRAGEALAAAQRLIARDPAVALWLDQTKLGDHPKFVRVACAKAMQLKAKGKL